MPSGNGLLNNEMDDDSVSLSALKAAEAIY
jgi:hypothetical protein